jgi:hypothetical protein
LSCVSVFSPSLASPTGVDSNRLMVWLKNMDTLRKGAWQCRISSHTVRITSDLSA